MERPLAVEQAAALAFHTQSVSPAVNTGIGAGEILAGVPVAVPGQQQQQPGAFQQGLLAHGYPGTVMGASPGPGPGPMPQFLQGSAAMMGGSPRAARPVPPSAMPPVPAPGTPGPSTGSYPPYAAMGPQAPPPGGPLAPLSSVGSGEAPSVPVHDPDVFVLTDRKVRVAQDDEDCNPYVLCRRWIHNNPYPEALRNVPADAGPPHPALLGSQGPARAQPRTQSSMGPPLPPLPPLEPGPHEGPPPEEPQLPPQVIPLNGEVPIEDLLLHHQGHWQHLRQLSREKAAHRLQRHRARLSSLMQHQKQRQLAHLRQQHEQQQLLDRQRQLHQQQQQQEQQQSLNGRLWALPRRVISQIM
ncbi:hypothetical protein WJX73_002250 [Symbiochloris irregularis]|uniref:Uncharacterized protein n=1 Tax=Symbiochloris irregularis TaxID=706552 RepID=A0AAW1PBA6_9CHLO